MSRRGHRRSSVEKETKREAPPTPGNNHHFYCQQQSARSDHHRGIVNATKTMISSSSAAVPLDVSANSRDILAAVKRRNGRGNGRRKMPYAGILVLFFALCAALLWVGVGSLSHQSGTSPKASARASSAGAKTTSTDTGTGTAREGEDRSSAAALRSLARRPELKTRGGQLAFARFSLLAEYPHDSTAFTQGLCYKEGFLYESTGLYGGKSTLRKVEVETGEVLQSVKIGERFFGEGMVIVGDTIHSLTWRSKVAFSWDLETFEQKEQFEFETSNGQGWGITADDKSLIVSDGSHNLMFWDPVTMKETGRIEVKLNGHNLGRLNELEMVKGYVFANVWYDDNVYKIDPATGEVVETYNFSELYPKALQKKELKSKEAVLNGIAWDPTEDVLYLTGKLWPRMYKIKLHETDADDSEEGPESSTGSDPRRRQ